MTDINLTLQDGKKIYFASDFHLGVPTHESSLLREKRIVNWLNSIEHDAQAVFLVGDMFDFWFEYRHVVPKGFVRLLGTLARLSDNGIRIHLFHGNHDLWQFGYLEKELNCTVHNKPVSLMVNQTLFHIAHGDGIGPGQHWFKFILSVYRNRFFQRLFAFFHPFVGMSIAQWVSHRSKLKTFDSNKHYLGDNKEYLMLYTRELLKQNRFSFCIYGHRHLPFEKKINDTTVLNLGDWFSSNTYAVYDGTHLNLHSFNA
ncbi:MAG: UDP-2,3-diacylglucosamine diphosphatase [Bacteroidota bacterium]